MKVKLLVPPKDALTDLETSYISKFKFEKTKFLPMLTKSLNKIFNKKIEYNIINLKSIIYSPDIFTKLLALKLRAKIIKLGYMQLMLYILGKINYQNHGLVNKNRNRGTYLIYI